MSVDPRKIVPTADRYLADTEKLVTPAYPTEQQEQRRWLAEVDLLEGMLTIPYPKPKPARPARPRWARGDAPPA